MAEDGFRSKAPDQTGIPLADGRPVDRPAQSDPPFKKERFLIFVQKGENKKIFYTALESLLGVIHQAGYSEKSSPAHRWTSFDWMWINRLPASQLPCFFHLSTRLLIRQNASLYLLSRLRNTGFFFIIEGRKDRGRRADVTGRGDSAVKNHQ